MLHNPTVFLCRDEVPRFAEYALNLSTRHRDPNNDIKPRSMETVDLAQPVIKYVKKKVKMDTHTEHNDLKPSSFQSLATPFVRKTPKMYEREPESAPGRPNAAQLFPRALPLIARRPAVQPRTGSAAHGGKVRERGNPGAKARAGPRGIRYRVQMAEAADAVGECMAVVTAGRTRPEYNPPPH
ncbi:hypothetical protein NDU88_006497 [Pleurodeles waltl]|uniref:Uncharacterized protein n=1 Tax=Pleurodeles waltl TaxID=8319 RepID=A0AAV7X1Q4_PLEWA|nr:hypothetical protein NDU88_006497 [Pleurodeles waltl]